MEWSEWAAILELAVLTKVEIEVRNKLQAKPPSVEPSEPIHELEISVDDEAQKKSRCTKSKQKRNDWGNRFQKERQNGVLWNSFPWDEADAKVRSYLFLLIKPMSSTTEKAKTQLTRCNNDYTRRYCHHKKSQMVWKR